MADLFYTVFRSASEVAMGDQLAHGKVTIAGTANESGAIGLGLGLPTNHRMRVRLFADANCFVSWGANPSAANDGSDGMPMGNENPEYVNIQSGHQISVISR